MAYPQTIDNFPARIDGTSHWAEHQNELQRSVMELEKMVGTKGNPNVIINPVGGTLPAPMWSGTGVVMGVYANGTVKASLHWVPVMSTECVGYIIQRAITAIDITVTPTSFDVIATVSGKDNSLYSDSAGLKVGFKYWYRIAGQNIKGETGLWSSVRSATALTSEVIGNPNPPVDLSVYLDSTGNIMGNWKYLDPDLGSNWYSGANVVINANVNPADGPIRNEGFIAYPGNLCNLTALWPKDMGTITPTTKLYFHVKTMSVWGLESAYVTYGPFSVGTLLDNYVSFQWSAYANFKLLLESHYYSESGDPYTYLPGEFVSEGSGLVYMGEKIAAGSIQTHALAVGSGHRNYDIIGLEYHQNNRVKAGDINGEAAEHNLRITTTTVPWLLLVANASERPNDILRWQITKFNDVPFAATHPDSIGVSHAFATLTSAEEPYKVYFKCSKTVYNDAQIIITKDRYQPVDGDYYYYLAGMWDVREGKAGQLALSYGFTFIDGNHITTGIIDCTKVNVHGAGSDVIISGSGLDVINGKMTFRTGTIHDSSGVVIDSEGIRGGSATSYFRLDKNLGLSMTFGAGEYIKLDKDGLDIASSTNRLQANAGGISITSENGAVSLDAEGLHGPGFELTGSAGLVITAAGGGVQLNANGLTGPNFKLLSTGLEIKSGNGAITITGTSITGPNFTIDEDGLDYTSPPPAGTVTSPLGTGNTTHLDAYGVWTGTNSTTNCTRMDNSKIVVNSTQQECLMGLLPDGTYGFWAGPPTGSHVKMNRSGITAYDDDGTVIFDTTQTKPIVNTRYASTCLISSISGTVSGGGRNFSVVLNNFGAAGTHGFNYAVAHYSSSAGYSVSGAAVTDCSGTNITFNGTVSGPDGNAAVGVKIWLFKADMAFLQTLASGVSTNWV